MRVVFSLFFLLFMINAALGQSKYKSAARTYNIDVIVKDSTVNFSYLVDFHETDSTDHAIYETTSLDTLLLLLKDDLAEIPDAKRNLLIYLHGMMGGQKLNLHHTKKDLNKRYVEPVESDISRLISIRWPGNTPIYKSNKENIKKVGPDLAKLVSSIISELRTSEEGLGVNFDVLIHSMGSQMFTEVFQHLPKNQTKYFDQILFCAPDLDIDAFNRDRPLSSLHLQCERITVYTSNKDVTLGFSRELNKKGRLGLDGPHIETAHHPALYFVDMSQVSDEKLLPMRLVGHSYYRASDLGSSDILQTLNGVAAEKITGREPCDKGSYFYKVISSGQ